MKFMMRQKSNGAAKIDHPKEIAKREVQQQCTSTYIYYNTHTRSCVIALRIPKADNNNKNTLKPAINTKCLFFNMWNKLKLCNSSLGRFWVRFDFLLLFDVSFYSINRRCIFQPRYLLRTFAFTFLYAEIAFSLII